MQAVIAEHEYPICRTSATIPELRTKAALLPEGPDVVRATTEEVKALFESGQLGLHLQDRPTDMNADGSCPDEEVWDYLGSTSLTELWGTESIASKVLQRVRDRENYAYADSWLFEIAPAVTDGVAVIPDIITIEGLKVSVAGRYSPISQESSYPSEQTDPNDWRIMACIGYDFSLNKGSISFTR